MDNNNDMNYSEEFLTQGLFRPSGEPTRVEGYEPKLQQKIKREKSVEYATLNEKVDSFFLQAGRGDHLGASLAEWAATKYYTDFEDDENYSKSDLYITETIKQNSLPIDSYGDLRDAKSEAEFNFILEIKKREKKENEKIAESLSDRAMMAASVTGMIGDVDMVAGYGIGKLFTSEKVMKIAVTEGAVEAALAVTRMNLSDNYDSKDMVIDIGSGIAVAVGVSKFFNKMVKDPPPKPTEEQLLLEWKPEKLVPEKTTFMMQPEEKLTSIDIVRKRREEIETAKKTYGTPEYKLEQEFKADSMAQARRQEGMDEDLIEELRTKELSTGTFKREINVEFKQNQKKLSEIDNKIRKMEKEWNEEVATAKETQKHYDDLAELRSKAATARQEIYNKEVARRAKEDEIFRKLEQDRIREEELALDNYLRNKELAERFRDPKYESYKLNRKEFFSKQDEIAKQTELDSIKRIEDTRSNISKKLSQYNKELKELLKSSTPSAKKVNFRKQKIKELNKELKDLKDQLDNMKKPKEKPIEYTPQETKVMRMVDEMMEDVVTEIDDLRDVIKNSSKEELESINGFVDTVNELFRREPKLAKEIHDMLGSKLGNKVLNKAGISIDDVVNRLGKASDKTRKFIKDNKIKTIALASLAGTSLSAAEGDIKEELTTAFVAAITIGALLYGRNFADLYNTIKNKQVKSKIQQYASRVDKSYNKAQYNTSPEAGRVRRFTTWLADISHTRFTSAIAPMIKAGGEIKEFAEKMFFSHQGGDAIELLRRTWNDVDMADYQKIENKYYDAWLVETKQKGFFKEMTNEEDLISKFRDEVSTNMRKRNTKSKAIKQMTEENDKIWERLYNRPKEYGVFGFDQIKYEKGKLPRLWNNGALYDMLKSTTPEGRETIISAFEQGFYAETKDRKASRRMAEQLVNRFSIRTDVSSRQTGSIFELVEDLLKDDVNIEDFANSMATIKDASGRVKSRLPLDVDAIPDFTIDVNGVQTKFNKSMLFENNSKKLLDLAVSEMNGLAAIGKAGYKTVSAAEEVISKFPREFQQRGEVMLDMLLGRTPRTADPVVDEIINAMKDLTISEKLPFVMFSVPYEMLKTITNGGFIKSIQNVSRMIKVRNEMDVARLEQLISMTGSSTGYLRADKRGFMGKTTDNIAGIDDAGSNIRGFTHRVSTLAMIGNGLTKFTDWMQSINLLRNEDRLAEHITSVMNGGEGVISAGRLKTYNIDDSFIKEFKDDFKYVNGTLQKVDMSKWSQSKIDKYIVALKRMGQEQVLEHTIGETSQWGNTSTIGKVLNTLVGYPLMMHNHHFQNGMRQLDRTFLFDNLFAFGGSYMGMQLKYELLGKDVSDEQIASYALMNTLPFSALTSINSMSDPAVFQVLETATNLIDPLQVGDAVFGAK